jgi:hypothetical protein
METHTSLASRNHCYDLLQFQSEIGYLHTYEFVE